MKPEAMEPHGMAMLAFFDGDTSAELIIHRDDGQQTPLPVSYFFRDTSEFTSIDKTALEHCKGHVLDVGAGTGLHSLFLQKKGLSVTSLDICTQAVEIMEKREVKNACCVDIFDFQGGPFDTILMMGHGIGIAETIAGLDLFLEHAHSLLSEDGQLILDSLDVRITDDPNHLAYLETNRREGRYIGEIRLQFEFQGKKGPYFGWLQVDPDALNERAETSGWRCDVILQEKSGDYLAKLARP
jgi:SAM-dependent methyltransferase